MKKILLLTELLHYAFDAHAADDGAYTPAKDYFLSTLLAAIDAKNDCGVTLDADAILAGAASINLDLDTAERRYPRPFYATIQRHQSLRNSISVAGEDRVCSYLIRLVDQNPQFMGWRSER